MPCGVNRHKGDEGGVPRGGKRREGEEVPCGGNGHTGRGVPHGRNRCQGEGVPPGGNRHQGWGGVTRGGNRREGEGVLYLIVEATDARGRGCLLEATGTRQGVLRGGNRHQAACMSGIIHPNFTYILYNWIL